MALPALALVPCSGPRAFVLPEVVVDVTVFDGCSCYKGVCRLAGCRVSGILMQTLLFGRGRGDSSVVTVPFFVLLAGLLTVAGVPAGVGTALMVWKASQVVGRRSLCGAASTTSWPPKRSAKCSPHCSKGWTSLGAEGGGRPIREPCSRGVAGSEPDRPPQQRANRVRGEDRRNVEPEPACHQRAAGARHQSATGAWECHRLDHVQTSVRERTWGLASTPRRGSRASSRA